MHQPYITCNSVSTVSYPDTVDCYSLYHALLNASFCLIQVSLSNSPFSLKSTCLEYVPILDLILPRSTHDCFAWIDNSILILYKITYSILAHFYLVYLSLKSPTLISLQLCLRSSTSYLLRYSSYRGSVKVIFTQVFFILW